MARKKSSKQLWVDGEVHSSFKKKIEEEGWTWGITKKLEQIIKAYVKGELAAKELQVHRAHQTGLDGHAEKDKEKQRRHGEPRIGYWKHQIQLRANK